MKNDNNKIHPAFWFLAGVLSAVLVFTFWPENNAGGSIESEISAGKTLTEPGRDEQDRPAVSAKIQVSHGGLKTGGMILRATRLIYEANRNEYTFTANADFKAGENETVTLDLPELVINGSFFIMSSPIIQLISGN